MNKIIYLIVLVVSFLFISPVFAQDLNPYTYNNKVRVNPSSSSVHQGLATDNSDADTEGSDSFYNEMISDDYGSTQSPAFNNREEINPGESDYGYGYSDGLDNDGGGDSTDPYQSN